MKWIVRVALATGFFIVPTALYAHRLDGPGCDGNGQECKVYCNNGNLAGTMYYDQQGKLWTDGVKSDPDKEREADMICAANGTDCV